MKQFNVFTNVRHGQYFNGDYMGEISAPNKAEAEAIAKEEYGDGCEVFEIIPLTAEQAEREAHELELEYAH